MARARTTKRAEPSPEETRPSRLWLALLAIAVLVAYRPAYSAGFLNFDDDKLVVENPIVAGGFTADGLRRAFTESYFGNWVPLTWSSYMLDRELFGLEPAGPHVVNVLLHVASVLLLYLLARRLLASGWAALAVAALFGLHPLHVESVAWIAERKDVLSTALLLGTLLAWLVYLRAPSTARYALALALMALGLMAKPMLVTLPCLMLLLDAWPLGRLGPPTARTLWKRVIEKLPFFALAAGAGAVAVLAQKAGGAVQETADVPLWARPANAAIAAVTYLYKALVPHGLAIFVPHPRAGVSIPLALLSAGFLALATVVAVRARRTRPYLLFGWLWFLGTLVPVLGLLQVGEQALAYRYTYVPMIGVYLALAAWGRDVARERALDPALLKGTGVAASLALAVLTFRHARHWRDDESVYLYALSCTEGNYVAHNNLAASYADSGRYEEALEHARAALAIEPGYVDALVNVAAVSGRLGRNEDVVEACRAVLAERPTDPRALQNLGAAEMALGRREEALDAFERLVAAHPQHLFGLQLAGRLCLELDRLDEADRHFRAAIALAPEDASARFGLGLVHERKGEREAARACFEEALARKPDFAPAREALGRMRGGAAVEKGNGG